MKLAEVVIKPISPFGTPLKGDTIFGHFFWQVVYDPSLIKGDLERLVKTYIHEPFFVFSSAFPCLRDGWLLPRPTLPLGYLVQKKKGPCFESLKRLKQERKKKWIKANELKIDLKGVSFFTEMEAAEIVQECWKLGPFPTSFKGLILQEAQPHNSINRLTFTTGEGFAPYQTENYWFLPGLRLSVFVLYQPELISLDNIKKAFSRMGQMGFGRDASTGLGRFEVEDLHEHDLPGPAQTLYTLGPYVPQQDDYEEIWYQPFVRYGRHGSYLVLTGRPFKNPVLMAEEGAVLRASSPKGPLLGRALTNLSKAEERTIGQGFSIVLPVEGL